MISYTLDKNNIIRAVGGDWNAFAKANGGATITRESIVGSPFFRNISGEAISQLYHSLFEKVRDEHRALSFTCRCDGPTCRRRLKITIAPLPEGAIFVVSDTLSEESRPPVPIMDVTQPRSDELMAICCICARVRSASGEWVEIEVECERRKLLEQTELPNLTHGYCPPCLQEQRALLARRKSTRDSQATSTGPAG